MRPLLRKTLPGLGLLMILQSCSSDGVGPSDPITELPRDLTLAEVEVIGRSNSFGFQLLKEVEALRDGAHPNTVLSPLSATMALGMALEGTDGETFTSMRDALGFQGLLREEVNASYRGLLDLLPELDPEVEVSIANSAWAREAFPFHSTYFDAVSTYFDAEVRELDFGAPGAKDIINGWVREETNGRIEEIVETITPLDILFLINAVYFKGNWTTRFDRDDTRPSTFELASGERVNVPTMKAEDLPISLANVAGVQIGELPYGGGAFSLVVAIPSPGQKVDELVAGLDDSAWAAWMSALREDTLPVSLPKFELEWDGKLNDALKAMGMELAFQQEADFSRMTPAPDAHISRVKQKTYMKVDEEGTEAAAATSVAISLTSMPMGFYVDRPFVVAIRERLSGTILFLGVIRDPR
ncbi:serpin family protein [Gemmatimonadota bacterium]